MPVEAQPDELTGYIIIFGEVAGYIYNPIKYE